MKTTAVWFRQDLRIDDHPALSAACEDMRRPVRAVVFVSEQQWDKHQVGRNARAAWLTALDAQIENLKPLNIPLDIIAVEGWRDIPLQLQRWCNQHAVSELHFNIELPFDERARDQAVCKQLKNNVSVVRHSADMLIGPWQIANNQGSAFKVFTPYSKRVRQAVSELVESNRFVLSLPAIRPEHAQDKPQQDILDCLRKKYLSASSGLVSQHAITELQAQQQLKHFLEETVVDYAKNRDVPSIEGTSRLSVALAVGSLSARRAFFEASMFQQERAHKWSTELIWRDFYRYIMWHNPTLCQGLSFRHEVESYIDWNENEEMFQRWCDGTTGIPIIDAAMRQLNQTGWMHNRLRMIVASFLTKNLWQDWRKGEAWFASQLIDYDFASNIGGWQWSASIGTDAAPYFRVFNPASQQKKFDTDATFIKRWVPELRNYSAKSIHQFESQTFDRYPRPVVDLKASRKLAIIGFEQALRHARSLA